MASVPSRIASFVSRDHRYVLLGTSAIAANAVANTLSTLANIPGNTTTMVQRAEASAERLNQTTSRGIRKNSAALAAAKPTMAMPISRKDTRMFVRHFLAGAAEVEVDKQGRILIPSVLREFADITKDAVLVGVGSRIEIWSRERWEGTVSFEDMDEISNHMFELGIGI